MSITIKNRDYRLGELVDIVPHRAKKSGRYCALYRDVKSGVLPAHKARVTGVRQRGVQYFIKPEDIKNYINEFYRLEVKIERKEA